MEEFEMMMPDMMADFGGGGGNMNYGGFDMRSSK